MVMKLQQAQVDALDWREPENESSQIARVAWVKPGDPLMAALPDTFERSDVGALVVEFRSGGVYAYDDVTEEEHGELVEADSAGGYLNTQIKPERLFERAVIEE